MGFSYRAYVGPFVACYSGTLSIQRERTACTNATCSNHERHTAGAFCSLCGSPVGTVTYAERGAAVDADAVREAINERLTMPSGDAAWEYQQAGQHLWKSNIGMPGRDPYLDDADYSATAITAEDIAQEIRVFSDLFATDLDYLRQVYGAEAVQVRWGIIQDYI